MALKHLFSVFAVSAFILLFTVFTSCVATATPVSYYRPVSQNQENLTVDEWIERGDAFYFGDDYDSAKECYFQALMGDPARTDILNSYGVTLANTGFYENALVIFNFASKIDPSDETVQYNISFCRQQIAMQTEQQKQLQLQAQQQQQESFNNLIASLNTLASSMQQQQQRQSGGSGGSSSGQGQTETSSGSSSSSGRDRSDIDVVSMQRNYNTRENATIMARDEYNKALSSGASKSEIIRLREAFIDQQRGLKAYREQCNRKGADIRPSRYESVTPEW